MRSIATCACAAIMIVVVGCGGDLNHSAVRDTVAGGEVVEPRDSMQIAGGILLASLSEWRIDMPVDTVGPGRYTFMTRNAGHVAHALEVEGQDDYEVQTGHMAPSSTQEITVDLKPGTYEVYCPLEDAKGKHRDRGMRRTIVVRPSASR